MHVDCTLCQVYLWLHCKKDDLDSLLELRKSLDLVSKHKGNIWLLGDFNMPKLTWPDYTPVLKPDYSCKPVYECFLEILHDFSFCQMVTEPTRHENILDLLFTINHNLIDVVKCLPGLADHDIVPSLGSIKPTIQKQKPHQVHLFSTANWEKLKSLMRNYQETFLSECSGKTVEELWQSFTSTLEKHVNDCVPTKLIRGKSSLPFWFISVFVSIACLKFAKWQYVSSGFRCRVITGSLMRLY